LLFAASINPPLPRVEIVSSEGDELITGRLVGHVDGFWHFFSEADVFTSVPDDKVTVITTRGANQVSGTLLNK
jgi:hypothetical protein